MTVKDLKEWLEGRPDTLELAIGVQDCDTYEQADPLTRPTSKCLKLLSNFKYLEDAE